MKRIKEGNRIRKDKQREASLVEQEDVRMKEMKETRDDKHFYLSHKRINSKGSNQETHANTHNHHQEGDEKKRQLKDGDEGGSIFLSLYRQTQQNK